MKLTFVTGNTQKFQEAEIILQGYDLVWEKIDLPELQGDRKEVVIAKARAAYEKLKRPLFVEDVSICCPALGGLPGPFVKFFLKAIGADGFQELVHKYDDRRADAICTVALILPEFEEPQLFEGVLHGTIVRARGDTRHGIYSWNSIFLPAGAALTMGEMSMEEHSRSSHRRLALEQMQAFLANERTGSHHTRLF